MQLSWAQNFEDIMLWRALNEIEIGTYIDVGANSPHLHSITKVFYEKGWSGINIEPVQEFYDELCEERPRDINICSCISDKDNQKIDFFEVEGTGLSTGCERYAKQAKTNFKIKKHTVTTKTLDLIIKENELKGDIHFLKIDVEGMETSVLRGLTLKKTRPWILVIEGVEPLSTKESHKQWEGIILKEDYKFVYFDGLNRFYLAKEHSHLNVHFLVPPNINDPMFNSMFVKVRSELPLLSERLEKLTEQADFLNKHIKQQDSNINEHKIKIKKRETELDQNRNVINEHKNVIIHYKGEFDQLNTAYYSIINSKLWKFTYPYRKLREVLKQIYQTLEISLQKRNTQNLVSAYRYWRKRGTKQLLIKVRGLPDSHSNINKHNKASDQLTPHEKHILEIILKNKSENFN